jgi:hypothetical protein
MLLQGCRQLRRGPRPTFSYVLKFQNVGILWLGLPLVKRRRIFGCSFNWIQSREDREAKAKDPCQQTVHSLIQSLLCGVANIYKMDATNGDARGEPSIQIVRRVLTH